MAGPAALWLAAALAAAQPGYDASVRASQAATDSLAGPLDGAWSLIDLRTGEALYRFEIADPGPADGPAQGAWRNPAVRGARGSGPIDAIVRTPHGLVLRFTDDGLPRTVRLEGRLGAWRGRLEGADKRRVAMRRP